MGCDGGTIPRRDELVKLKKKPEQKDKEAERSFKWRNCALSQQRLQQPIVACGLGRLYSKSSVLEALLDKERKPDSINHIKNLKDIKDLKLAKNPAYVETERASGAVDEGSSPYICPISDLEMTGKFRFVFLWSCGCVLAERALNEVKQNLCHVCQSPFTNEDVVVLNGTEEDIKEMTVKMVNRNATRKSKKVKRIKTETQSVPSTTTTELTVTVKIEPDIKTEPEDPAEDWVPSQGTAAVKKEVDTISLSLPKNDNKFTKNILRPNGKRPLSNDLLEDPSYKKTKKEYSIAKDPKSSEVYKSIFTSHKSDKDQQRAHWVTYNPFYN